MQAARVRAAAGAATTCRALRLPCAAPAPGAAPRRARSACQATRRTSEAGAGGNGSGGREQVQGGKRAGKDGPKRGKLGKKNEVEYYKALMEELAMDDGEELDAPFMDAVVKVYCSHSEPNFSLPWQRRRQYSSTSSGFIIGGRRVLTNAHSVEHHTQVMVQRRGDDQKYAAKVLAIGPECDIALLSVEDDDFFGDVEPLRLGPLPRLQDSVSVVGYPLGGDTISVTQGVVSRIEVTNYVHGMTDLLGIQIDAAINSGNSGGPAFNEHGDCVGIAFQSLKGDDAENIGYVIPTPVVAHFLADYAMHGKYTGFPVVGFDYQGLESPALRASLGMAPNQKGVLMTRVLPTAPAASVLKKGDVLRAFDGTDIACDGTLPFRTGERIAFGYLVSQKFVGDSADLRIMRGGKDMDITVTLGSPTMLVPAHYQGSEPPYLIIAGLVFTAVCEPYLRSEYGEELDVEVPVQILDKMLHGVAEVPGEQVVVLSQVLAADCTVGYEDMSNLQVLTFNGVRVRSLAGLSEAVTACQEAFFRFELDSGEIIVMNAEQARKSTPTILATHSIPAAASPDLLPPLSGSSSGEQQPQPAATVDK